MDLRNTNDPLLLNLKKQYSDLRYKHHGVHGNSLDTFITFEQMIQLLFSKCHYCGCEGSVAINDEHGRVILYKNTIDRINCDGGGYSLDNCVTACFLCNMTKGALNEAQMYSWVKKIYEYKDLSDFEAVALDHCRARFKSSTDGVGANAIIHSC